MTVHRSASLALRCGCFLGVLLFHDFVVEFCAYLLVLCVVVGVVFALVIANRCSTVYRIGGS